MGRYVYMEAIYPRYNARKFYELEQDGKRVFARNGRIAEGYEGRVSPGGVRKELKNKKFSIASPFWSEEAAVDAIGVMVSDKENHKKTPYVILKDSQVEDKKIAKLKAALGIVNHQRADRW